MDKSEWGVGFPPRGGSLAQGPVGGPAARGCPGAQNCGNVSFSKGCFIKSAPGWHFMGGVLGAVSSYFVSFEDDE